MASDAVATARTKKKSRGKMLPVVLASIALICIAALVMIFRHRAQAAACIEAWLELKKEQQWLTAVPRPMPIAGVAAAGEPIRQNGFEFSTPWVKTTEGRQSKFTATYVFSNGVFVMFEVVPNPGYRAKSLRQQFSGESDASMNVALGADLQSNYGLYMAMMNANVDDISLFMPRAEALRDIFLLPVKVEERIPFPDSVFVISLPNVRGTQTGNPERNEFPVRLDLFDTVDREIKLRIGILHGSQYHVTQPEINEIINSIHAVPDAPVLQAK